MLVHLNRFDGGIADDYTRPGSGQCAMCKGFDVFTYPFRLQPLRGMTSSGELTGSNLRNIILGTNGTMYGIGENPLSADVGELYKRTGYGSSDFWTDFGTDQIASSSSSESAGHYDFLVHFPEMGATRKLFWSCNNLLIASDPADGGGSTDTDTLVFTNIGQGLVHPKHTALYFPYTTSSATYIGSIENHATDCFGAVDYTLLSLPNRYRAYCLSHYGAFLAIPLTVSGRPNGSIVALWDPTDTAARVQETIPWGDGLLKVLNNLNGALIGISVLSGENSAAAQDVDKLQVKIWEGGAEPVLIKELVATRTTTTAPSCAINQRVNFIHNNRLYFSVNLVNGDADANYYGLWSVGKNKLGQWTVVCERGATNDNSETGVIAAAFYGDFLSTIHSSEGTLTYTQNGNVLADIYGATSFYETGLNPQMPEADRYKKKKLEGIYCTFLALPAAASVTVKYRVNSLRSGAWTTIKVESTDGATRMEALYDTNMGQLSDFTDVEFRLESTGGAIITGFGYKYDTLDTQL